MCHKTGVNTARTLYIPFFVCICSIFGFHGFSQKKPFRKSFSRLAEFVTQATEKLWALAKKVKIFGLGNYRESSTITCDDICFPSNQCWDPDPDPHVFGLPDPDPLVRGTDPALDPDLHVFGPPGSGSISQRNGSGSGSGSGSFPILIKLLSGLI